MTNAHPRMRYGDANLNGRAEVEEEIDFKQLEAAKRRSTKQYLGQQTNNGTACAPQPIVFKEFTQESLAKIQSRKQNAKALASKQQQQRQPVFYDDKAKLEPDPYMVSGSQLPPAIIRQMPSELVGKPIEDIDPYYEDKETFVIISRGKELIRFSAKPSLYLLGPLNPIRRIVLRILVSSIFNLLVIMTILVNCVLMTMQSDTVEKTEIIFTIIYTTEFILRVLARGFIIDRFTYLHDPWNVLDFVVIIMAYMTLIMGDSLGNFSVIRSFRVLRALKTVAIIPGMKTIVGAVIDSVKNLKDVVVLTLFSLTVFSLLGLQIYQGVLTQKCILNGPEDMNDSAWFAWNNDSSHWVEEKDSEIYGAYRLCGNASGAQNCPPDHTCLQGFGPNPDHGYTNFDTFGWSLICSFRLMTQDFWEGLYMQVLKTAGSWHIIFFIISIFLGSIYLMNLILAIVAMSYNELQRRAEEEEEAAAEDEAAFLESCRLMELQSNMSQHPSGMGTPEVGASYRPSLELGLVGQTFLAGLCQQMMLPNVGGGGATHQSRSHSLCVDQHHRNQSLRPNYYYDPMAMAASMAELRRKSSVRTNESGSGSTTRNCGGGLGVGGGDNESQTGSLVGQRRLLPNIGIKGNRLDRQNSVRLRPTSRRSPHHLSLMSNHEPMGAGAQAMERHRSSTASVDLQTLRHRAVIIEGGLRNMAKDNSYSIDDSTEGLKSDQQKSLVCRTFERVHQSAGHSHRHHPHHQRASMQMSPIRRRRSVRSGSSLSGNGVRNLSIDPTQSPFKYRSEVAICGQPSHAHPLGRMVVQQRLEPLDTPPTTRVQLTRCPQRRRSSSNQRRYSCRRCSTLSNVEHSTYLRRTSASNFINQQPQASNQLALMPMLANAERTSTELRGISPNTLHPTMKSCSMRTLQSSSSRNSTNQNSPTDLSPKSAGSANLQPSAPAGASSKQLSVDAYLPQGGDRMHHLSVENFQQFGAIRPISMVQQQQQLLRSRQHSIAAQEGCGVQFGPRDIPTTSVSQVGGGSQAIGAPVDSSNVSHCHQAGGQANSTSTASMAADNLHHQRKLSLRQRGRRDSRLYIHPSTMVARSSFSRIRQSMYAGDSHAPSEDYKRYLLSQHNNQLQLQNQQAQQHRDDLLAQGALPFSGVRRLSRDFVRQADDWSRVSVGANVDLRRLLRLWSHTNPKSGGGRLATDARPSIGSCSIYSQENPSYRFNVESPQHSIKQAASQQQVVTQNVNNSNNNNNNNNNYNSPPASSVGSQAWQAYEVLSAINRRNRYMSNANAFGASLPLDDNVSSDHISINARDRCIAYCLSCLDILCIWECCAPLQRLIALVVFDPFTELFIILCILVNTLFMALDSDDADEQLRKLFEKGNYFFTATFAVEASMKIIALSPKFYFSHGWNVFDAIIVGLSLLELGLEGVYGLSVLRSFRLLRVFKLAKSWPTLNLLISIMGKAMGDLGNLTFVLAIIVFIFAVMGMQLFGSRYEAEYFPDGELPRWNFTDFMHSFMIVFRVLCAEFIEPMWDCLLVSGWPCIPFFLVAVTVGNLVVLNLFLALLLASFGASNLSSPQADNVDTRKLREAIERFARFGRFLRRTLGRFLSRLARCLLRRKRDSRGNLEGLASSGRGGDHAAARSHIVTMSRMERQQNISRRTRELKIKVKGQPKQPQHSHLRQLAKSQLKQQAALAVRHPPAINFNYETHKSTHAGGSSEEHQQLMPSIPIIVNEPSEENEESGTTGAWGTTGGDGDGPGGPITTECDLDERTGNNIDEHFSSSLSNQQLAATCEESASLSSDVSLNMSDLSLTTSGVTHEGQSAPSSTRQSVLYQLDGGAGGVFSSNMHTIREDSRDESSCVSLSASEDSRAGQNLKEDLAADHQLNYRKRMSISMNQMSSGDRERLFAHERGHHQADGSRFKGGETQAQLQEPLLTKSKSDPDSKFAAPRQRTENHAPSSNQVKGGIDQLAVTTPGGATSGSCGDDDEEDPDRPKSSMYLQAPKRQQMEEEDELTLQHIESYIEKCMCIGIICLKWFLFRQFVRRIVEHRYFDQCILILIIISSGTLALEDRHLDERPTLKRTLDVLDTLFTILFSLEMILKWLSFGLRRYFSSGFWSWLDFIIVLVSLVNLMASVFGSGKIQALKTMRTLRAMRGLRPLRALQRFQGMRVVVNALIQAIPSIFNVLLVCLIFWLIFSIMGVQAFGGKFWRCLSPETRELVPYEVARDKFECIEKNLTWANPQINFDNVLNAYLALFQVATFKGWLEIMDSATDSRQRDEQPVREANIYMYFYFVFFVIFGSFFTLNLFIGVIIDNFNEQKKKTGGSLEMFMTDDQKKYYHAMKKMRSKKPQRAMTRPKFKPQAFMFDLTTSKKFDLAIMLIIGLNMFVMALEYYGQPPEFTQTLENLNLIFIAIFTLECLTKIFAMRHFYFREMWNVFDCTVVALSILGVLMKEYVAKYFVSPTLLRVVRVVKVGRVLRLVKGAKGIRCLLFALAMSLPALFNICLLLFLVMFIYAIFGMNLFGHVRHRAGIDDIFNFETFPSSIIVLFQMATSAGWDLVLDPLMDEENDCQKPDPVQGIEGTCGNRTLAIIFLVSYVIVTFLIIINMYIAVILENYSQATEDVQEGLTDDDYEMYYEIWQKFDPEGTQYLPYSKLSDFVDALEDPLRIPKPNELALVVMDINIYEGDRCYCVDILDALTKYFFTRKGLNISVTDELRQVQSTLHETPFERITTTYLLKRQHYSARLIQSAWRRWREKAKLGSQHDDCTGSRSLKSSPPGEGEFGPGMTKFQDVVSAKLLEYKNKLQREGS